MRSLFNYIGNSYWEKRMGRERKGEGVLQQPPAYQQLARVPTNVGTGRIQTKASRRWAIQPYLSFSRGNRHVAFTRERSQVEKNTRRSKKERGERGMGVLKKKIKGFAWVEIREPKGLKKQHYETAGQAGAGENRTHLRQVGKDPESKSLNRKTSKFCKVRPQQGTI